MNLCENQPSKVLVCGAGFGRIHLKAISMSDDFKLVGVFSRGSEGSRASAAQYGVPCFTQIDELPDDIDFACVAVPSATGAGEGTEIAVRLLERGVHVLQEVPLLSKEIIRANKAAQIGNARYRPNTMHSDLDSVKTFLIAAESIRKCQEPLFVDAACGVQVSYSLIDILTRVIGGIRPWHFDFPATPSRASAVLSSTRAPFSAVHGVVGGVPVTLRVQNEMNPSDLDNHALLLHRVSVGFEGGVLTLSDTHGPVLWNSRLHSSRDKEGKLLMGGLEHLEQRSTVVVGDPSTPKFQSMFDQTWPDAILSALRDLRDCSKKPEGSSSEMIRLQWELGVSILWETLIDRLGPARLINRDEPHIFDISKVVPCGIV